MVLKVTEARFVRDYILHLKFNDGLEGDVDLKDELDGEVFLPLKDPNVFKRFNVHPELHTLVWENDADFAPEFLHGLIKIPA